MSGPLSMYPNTPIVRVGTVKNLKLLETGASYGEFLKLAHDTMRSFVVNNCTCIAR